MLLEVSFTALHTKLAGFTHSFSSYSSSTLRQLGRLRIYQFIKCHLGLFSAGTPSINIYNLLFSVLAA